MKPKTFYITDKGEISRHKMRGAKIAGHGILHPSQSIITYTNLGNSTTILYSEVKVGTHFANPILALTIDEIIVRIDIISDNRSENSKLLGKYGMF